MIAERSEGLDLRQSEQSVSRIGVPSLGPAL
jgi:hypothetical protein